MRAATISPIYVKNVLNGVIKKGYNREEILRSLRLPAQILTNNKLRISTLEFANLTQAITELLRDEGLGLLTKPTPIGSFKLLAKACLSDRDIKESLATWSEATNLINNSVSAYTRIEDEAGYIAFDYQKADNTDGFYIAEMLLTSVHRFLCWLANDFLPIERVDLRMPEPDHSEEHRLVFYGAPVLYNQRQNAIYLSQQTMSRACQRSKEDLDALLRRPEAQLLTQPRQSTSMSIRVRLWMENLFRNSSGFPKLEEASLFFEMNEQTLRRRLKADGHSFKQLKEDTRRDMAMYYIKESGHSIEEIGFRLGFSEASTFIRAFKQWTGLTPLNYRKL